MEDEPDIAALLAYQLTRDGYRVETVASGTEALDAVSRDVPDLVVLDRMLPGVTGDDVLRQLRSDAATAAVPVIVLTARRDREDRIKGLELGADDYMTKPFSPRELVLRVQAVLRRTAASGVDARGRILRAGPIRLDVGAHEASVHDRELHLTPTELRLLQVLMERKGRAQSRQQLLERAWDVDSDLSGRIRTRTIDMHVRRLRAKLGDAGDWLETVRGFGYRLRDPAERA